MNIPYQVPNIISGGDGKFSGGKLNNFEIKDAAVRTGENIASSINKNITTVTQIFGMYYVAFFLLLFIVVTYFLYIYYSNLSTNVLVKNQVYLLNGPQVIANNDIINPSAISSSYSVWVYLNKIETGKTGTIFQLNNNNSFNIYTPDGKTDQTNGVAALYINDTNGLIFAIKDNSFNVMNTFPYQKWTNVFINIYEFQYYEFYINGKLVNTFKQKASKTPNKDSIIYLGGDTQKPDIVISNFTRQPYTQDSATIWNNYIKDSYINSSYDAYVPLGTNNIANRVMNIVDINFMKNFYL
jgi:hypothetical protein